MPSDTGNELLGRVDVMHGPVPLTPIADDLALPSTFTARVDDPRLPYLVTLQIAVPFDGRPRCIGLQVDPRDETVAIDGAGLRAVKVGAYVDAACRVAVKRLVSTDNPGEFEADALPPDENPKFADAWQQTYGREKKKRMTDDLLRELAEHYRAAVRAGSRSPREDARKKMDIATSTAGRWIQEARARGYLGPAIDRQPGEAN